MTEPPTTKPELLARIEERWNALQQLVSALSPADLERPLGDGWSTKVHLAHLETWERSLLGLLRGEHRGEAMGLTREVWDAHDLDATNAVIAERSVARPLDHIVRESDATHEEVMRLLNAMSQEDLEKPYSHYQPDDTPFNANPVGRWVHGNTWDHYDEHIGWIKAGLKG